MGKVSRRNAETLRRVTVYGTIQAMRFRHAGLRRYWERDDASRLNPDHVARIGRLLDDLAAADRPGQMDLPGLRLHQLVGDRRGTWSVRVSGNWRLTFRFEAGEAVDIDLEDYH